MKQNICDGLIPLEEQTLYKATGFGSPTGFGERAALLVIDVQRRTVGSSPLPVREAIKEYPTSCGEYGWAALPNVSRLLQCFRDRGLPVFFPHVAPKRHYDAGQFGAKVPAVMQVPPAGYQFAPGAEPVEGDICIPKYHPSAFFGTSLNSYLIAQRVDTLVITGATTSGCVRGTVVDASSYNYKVIVAQDAVYDRLASTHAVNLFDMASKYADVLDTDEIVRHFDQRQAQETAYAGL